MKLRSYLVSIFVLLVIVSCESETIKYDTPLPENVSFEKDILPLFDQHCNMAGCHDAGGIPPDLSPANSYNDLSSDSKMVNTNDAESSKLYKSMIDTKDPMPLSGILPPSQTNLVLVWIREGAKNN